MSKSTRAPLRSESFDAVPSVRMGHRAIRAASSLRSRAGVLTSNQLRGMAGDLLAGALGRLEERIRGSVSPVPSLERMREVLERDRALAFAERPAASAPQHPAAPSPSMAPEAPPPVVCDEPIRTRTFARLLAAQGHVERALSIYAYLLDQNPGDAALADEAAALRASPCPT